MKPKDDPITLILRRDPRYARQAYLFVLEVVRACKKDVSPAELLERLRATALERFGPLALTVLSEWSVASTADVGAIVFNLVEARAMRKTEDDHISDFDDVFDFAAAFPEDTGPVEIPRSVDDDV